MKRIWEVSLEAGRDNLSQRLGIMVIFSFFYFLCSCEIRKMEAFQKMTVVKAKINEITSDRRRLISIRIVKG